jgi:hypothetical protein
MIRRQHDVHVLAEGTFRVVMTGRGRIAAVIELQESALGPLHLMFAVQEQPPVFQTGWFGDDIVHSVSHVVNDAGHAVSHAVNDVGHAAGHVADQAFDSAAKAATAVARPVFNVARDAAGAGAQLIAGMPFVPQAERDKIAAASRVIMRARMGDIDAKAFIGNIAKAAQAGVSGAQGAANALLTGTRVVAHVLDAPMALAEHVPILGGVVHTLDPLQKLERVATAIQKGDFEGIKKIVTDDARLAQSVTSVVPGIGSGIGAAIGTGLAILDGGSPLDIAIHAAYGAIPIPPGIRDVTDAVLDAVLSLAHQGSVTDAALAAARNAAPAGLPRDVFDTLAQLVIKRVPVQRAADALVTQYVQRYAPSVPLPAGIAETVAQVAQAGRPGVGAAGALLAAGRTPLLALGAR